MSVPNIPGWSLRDRESRAIAVLDWCIDNGVWVGSIMGYQLDEAMAAWEASMIEERRAMGEGYDFLPSPMDYVHMIRAIAAFLRSRI